MPRPRIPNVSSPSSTMPGSVSRGPASVVVENNLPMLIGMMKQSMDETAEDMAKETVEVLKKIWRGKGDSPDTDRARQVDPTPWPIADATVERKRKMGISDQRLLGPLAETGGMEDIWQPFVKKGGASGLIAGAATGAVGGGMKAFGAQVKGGQVHERTGTAYEDLIAAQEGGGSASQNLNIQEMNWVAKAAFEMGGRTKKRLESEIVEDIQASSLSRTISAGGMGRNPLATVAMGRGVRGIERTANRAADRVL